MPNINSVNIMQLSNREGQMIAPFTPEHAIYDVNGIRLDVKLKALDIDRILALLKKYSGQGGGNGIAAIFKVGTDEQNFIQSVNKIMNETNEVTDEESGSAFNTYMAVLEVQPINFMTIDTDGKKAYALAKVSTAMDGGIDVFFDIDFFSYRYHFNNVILNEMGFPASQLYYEESGIAKMN